MRFTLVVLLLSLAACDDSFRQRTAKYALVCEVAENRAAVYDANTQGWGYVDSTGHLAIPCTYQRAATFSEGLAVVRTQTLYGYIDSRGQVVIQARYQAAESFVNGCARVRMNDLWGIIDRAGQSVVPCNYTFLGEPLSNGWTPVSIDTCQGYVTREGVEIVPCIYDQVEEPDRYGLVRVMKRAKYGLLNARGEEALPCQFAYIGRFHEERARINLGGIAEPGEVPTDGVWGVIDTAGRTMLTCRHFRIDEYIQGRALYQSTAESLLGYLDLWGHVAIEARYRVARPFQEGSAVVSINGIDFGMIDKDGTPLCDFRYKFIDSFREGLAEVNTDPFGVNYPGMKHRCGYIDTRGVEIIPLQYDDATPFSEGFAAVLRYGAVADFYDARWGYIDRHGKAITPFIYHQAEPFQGGLARVFIKNKGYGLIDTHGHPVVECRYDEVGVSDNRMVWVHNGDTRLMFLYQSDTTGQSGAVEGIRE